MQRRPDKRDPGVAERTGDRLGRHSIGSGVTIRSLEIFVAVAQTGSMVAAAKRLDLTQPAISQVIAGLEASLGIGLFDRSVRPPALTLQGATLLKHAAAVTEAIGKFQSALRLGRSAQLPLLRIGMLNSFAASIGPHVIKRLRDIAAEWSVDSGFNATRMQAVVTREFDFVVTADESPVPADVEALPVLTEPMLLIVPASYRGDATSLESLSEDLDMIRFGRDPHLHSRIDRLLQKCGLIPQRRYHLDTNEAVLAMVAVGSGWAILPPLAVAHSLARGDRVRALPLPGKPFQRRIMIASQKGEGRHIALQIHNAALDALREHFLPKLRVTLPHIIDRIVLHATAAK
jgi:DNA-binding transcriptional LysR family regulator